MPVTVIRPQLYIDDVAPHSENDGDAARWIEGHRTAYYAQSLAIHAAAGGHDDHGVDAEANRIFTDPGNCYVMYEAREVDILLQSLGSSLRSLREDLIGKTAPDGSTVPGAIQLAASQTLNREAVAALQAQVRADILNDSAFLSDVVKSLITDADFLSHLRDELLPTPPNQ